jgi:pimeloyl-ACP methyl ester carboxylesterase
VTFTPSHRGGAGEPMVLLHGFMETWRSWELVLPALERRHEVLAVTLAGHAGGPPAEDSAAAVADAVERAMDEAGFATAHLVGNSLGGYLAFQLAARGRARTVVALSPAGGWADDSYKDVLAMQAELVGQMKAAAPHAASILATPEGRRRATRLLTVAHEHIPAELLAHQLLAGARCHDAALAMIENGLRQGWHVEAERVTCPVRIVWGTEDRLLPWPSAAARYRHEWFPQADWVELEGVGHAPQLDVPLETAQLILGFT